MDDAAPLKARLTLLGIVSLLTAVAWTITYLQTRNMGLLMSLGVPMSLGMEGWANPVSFIAFTGMWMIMMIAMMLPSTYPTLLLHRTVYRKRHAGSHVGTLLFSLAYFLAWTAIGTLFYLAYVFVGFYRYRVQQSDQLILHAAGAALIISGLYQFSPLKAACLKHCQSPLTFVMHHWRDGKMGAFRMGLSHGWYCFGCCWGLMVVLFVMGVMHLGWMAAIGAIILLEKLVPAGHWIPRAIGIVFIGFGMLVLIHPGVLSLIPNDIVIG